MLRKMLRAPVFYDSSSLSDLRTIFTAGVYQSDTLLLLLTKDVLTRPWCQLEILEAKRHSVPIVTVKIVAKGFNVEAAGQYINELQLRLEDPAQVVRNHVGADLTALQEAMRSVLPAASEQLIWNPNAGDREVVARLKSIVEAIAAATGRTQRLQWTTAQREPTSASSGRRVPSLWSVFTSQPRSPCAAHIAFHPEEALSEARVLQTALSMRCHRRVGLVPSTGFMSEPSDGLVLLLSKHTLRYPACLVAVVETLEARKPVIVVLLDGRGYSFAATQQLLNDLRDELAPEELRDARASMCEHLVNVIAVTWYPEAGANQLDATVEDVMYRLYDSVVDKQAVSGAGRLWPSIARMTPILQSPSRLPRQGTVSCTAATIVAAPAAAGAPPAAAGAVVTYNTRPVPLTYDLLHEYPKVLISYASNMCSGTGDKAMRTHAPRPCRHVKCPRAQVKSACGRWAMPFAMPISPSLRPPRPRRV